MKKSLAILAAFAFGYVASAGTVTWQCYDIKNGSTYLDGGIAYLFVGDDVSSVATDIQAKTFDYSAALASATTDSEGCLEVKKIGNYVNQSVSLYMVVFDTATVTDNSKFVVSDVVTKSFGTSGNNTYKFTDSIAGASWTPVTVPEPTTVALLALGLAAVGLKRKIA